MLTEPLTVLDAGKFPTFTVPCTGSDVLTASPPGGPGSAALVVVGACRTARTLTHRISGRALKNLVIVVRHGVRGSV